MSVREPMTFEWAELDTLPARAADMEWVFEQKMDGTRGLAIVSPGGVEFVKGPGGRDRLGHTAATQHLPKIIPGLRNILGDTEGEIVLDGEIMVGSGEFHIFDVAYARFGSHEVVVPTQPLWVRRQFLDADDLPALLQGSPVKVVRQARTMAEKEAMWEAVQAIGGEGVMAKRRTGMYRPGVRTTDVLKYKLVKTADVVITGRTENPNAASASVYDEAGNLVPVGGFSMIGKPEVAMGDVVEINYLYWTGGSVYQPRMMRVREDKLASECLLGQFRPYSREVV